MSIDLPPIRCITCGNVLAQKWQTYQHLIENGISIEVALNSVGLRRYCCRIRMANPAKFVETNGTDSSLFEIRDETSKIANEKLENENVVSSFSVPSTASLLVAPDEDNSDREEEDEVPSIPVVKEVENKNVRVFRAW